MTPPIQISLESAVVLDAAVWAAWSFVVGVTGARLPVEVLRGDTWITRGRRLEREGRSYEHVKIRRWKDRLPEFGSFAGGRSKRHLPGHDVEALAAFAAETRRAEYVHWAILAGLPVFVLWNRAPLLVAMAVYAVVANVPCVAIQRYNRLRIQRIAARSAPTGARR